MANSKKKAAKGPKTSAKKKTGAKARTDEAAPQRSGNQDGPRVLALSDLVAKAPWRGVATSLSEAAPAPDSTGVAVSARPDPVRAPIDRRVPAAVFTVDKPVRIPETQKVVLILRRPLGFPAGSLPGDPGSFRPALGSAYSVCHVLAPAAAFRCAMRGRFG